MTVNRKSNYFNKKEKAATVEIKRCTTVALLRMTSTYKDRIRIEKQ